MADIITLCHHLDLYVLKMHHPSYHHQQYQRHHNYCLLLPIYARPTGSISISVMDQYLATIAQPIHTLTNLEGIMMIFLFSLFSICDKKYANNALRALVWKSFTVNVHVWTFRCYTLMYRSHTSVSQKSDDCRWRLPYLS